MLPVQEALHYELLEKRQARDVVKVPEATGLAERQTKTGHLRVLAANASQQPIMV